jgi:DNA polymerase/3'-5' exonuclease PolX
LLSAKQIAPGQSGEIEISVKTEGVPAINKTVTVTTNDPRNQQLVLTITAAVEPEFVLSERTIYFGNVPRGKEANKELIITITTDKPLKLLSVESTEPSFAARLESSAGGNEKKTRLVAVMKADAKDGYHFGTLVIKTSSSLTPELKVPVRGMVVAALSN